MKNITKLILTMLTVFILTINIPQNVVQAATLPLKYCIDFVKYDNEAKTINVQGWALSGNGIKSVTAVVNGKTYTMNTTYRPDVYNAYKQYNNKNAGFNKSIPVSNGYNTMVEIRIVEKNGKVTKATRTTETIKNIKDVSDKEILQTITDAYSVYCKIYGAFDYYDSVTVNKPSILSDYYSTFYRTKKPYDTPNKREEALKKYFVNYKILSNTIDDETQDCTDKLVKMGDYYYFCAYQIHPKYVSTYIEVTKKQYSGNKLTATLKRVWGGFSISYVNIEFVINNNQLKINNI